MRKTAAVLMSTFVFLSSASFGKEPPPPQEFNKQLNQTGKVINQTVHSVSSQVKEQVEKSYYDALERVADKIREQERNPQAYAEILKEEGKELVNAVVETVQNTVMNQAIHYATQQINQQLLQILGPKVGGFLAQFTESLLRGEISPEGILREGYRKILDWLADKVEGLNFPPRIKVGVPKVISVGGKKLPGYNDTDAQTVGLEGTLNVYPNPYLQDKCLLDENASPLCSLLYSLNTEEFEGVSVYSSVSSSYEKVKKDLAQSVVITAAGSNTEALEPGGEQIQKKRAELMTRAVLNASSVPPVGKKAVEKMPKPLRFKYAKVASDGAFRDAYLKSLQRRLIAHYAGLIALHKEIQAICSVPQKPVLENCMVGGSLIGSIAGVATGSVSPSSLSALSQLSKLNPSQVVSQISNANLSSVMSSVQKQSKELITQIQKQQNSLLSTAEKVREAFRVESRGACCGVCGQALAQARANAGLIKSSTATLMHTINTAAQQVSQTVAVQECMTRNALRVEMAQTRALLLTAECLKLHLKERELLIEIDQLESEVAQTGALMSILQNAEFKKLRDEYRKLVARGVE